jgi:hypothetical protein
MPPRIHILEPGDASVLDHVSPGVGVYLDNHQAISASAMAQYVSSN